MAETELIRAKLPKDIRWQGPEFHYFEKDDAWNKGIFVFAALLIVFAIWQRNWLFGIFILIATWLIIYMGHRKPDTVEFLFDEKGFTVHGKLRMYKDIEGFAIQINEAENIPWNRLILRMKARVIPHLIILIPKAGTEQIRTFLTEYLPEVEHDDSLIDLLADFLRF
jgi:hypothetical protein